MIFGRVNASARKITSGWSRRTLAISHSQNAHAFADPEQEHVFQCVPQILPLSALEVERIDVLVFFWRIFGVLHRAVGAPAEPFRVLLDPGMIWRALKCDVE